MWPGIAIASGQISIGMARSGITPPQAYSSTCSKCGVMLPYASDHIQANGVSGLSVRYCWQCAGFQWPGEFKSNAPVPVQSTTQVSPPAWSGNSYFAYPPMYPTSGQCSENEINLEPEEKQEQSWRDRPSLF